MSIVFGTTLRPEDEVLGEIAALLARRLGAPLRIVHVSEDPRAPVVLGTDEEHILGSVRAVLHAEAERLHSLTGAVVHAHLAAGTVVNALISVAAWELATVLVVGGRTGSSALLGDTAERASRKSSVPILTLRDPEFMGWLRGERKLRILVGADSGRAAQAARAFAVKLGTFGACETEVVLVASPREVHERLGLGPPKDAHSLAAEAATALQNELTRLAPAGEDAVVRVLAARGGADAHLVSLADQQNFDLIVVGQRQHSVVEQLWYGSVARGVLRAAPVSVACVPATFAPPEPLVRRPQIALVGIDFTEVSDVGLRYAVVSVAAGGTVHLAHVVPTGASATRGLSAREQAWHALSKLAAVSAGMSQVSVERHVLEGGIAEQLLGLAERISADVIVLGTRRRPVLGGALLASVTRQVTERARIPVLLVPARPA